MQWLLQSFCQIVIWWSVSMLCFDVDCVICFSHDVMSFHRLYILTILPISPNVYFSARARYFVYLWYLYLVSCWYVCKKKKKKKRFYCLSLLWWLWFELVVLLICLLITLFMSFYYVHFLIIFVRWLSLVCRCFLSETMKALCTSELIVDSWLLVLSVIQHVNIYPYMFSIHLIV